MPWSNNTFGAFIKQGLSQGIYLRGYRYILIPMHRLVWIEHNGPIPPGHEVHHIDSDKRNNRIDNLELVTKSEHVRRHNVERQRRHRAKIRERMAAQMSGWWTIEDFARTVGVTPRKAQRVTRMLWRDGRLDRHGAGAGESPYTFHVRAL
jgi:hypothetical protein